MRGTWRERPLRDRVSVAGAAQKGHPQSEASKNKISIANKGKEPWNKGVKHSDETRAKIAAASTRNARVKLEAKAAAMGMSLAEWDANLEEKRLEREKRPRIISEETRAKISMALKARWSDPEYKKEMKNKLSANLRNNTGQVRTHSPDTRKRISEALKKKWAEDPDYRQRVATTSISAETRGKISATLRERWRDPTFRALMTERARGEMSEEHRQKISDAIKLKWLDPVYRESATIGIRKANGTPRAPQSRLHNIEAAKERRGNRPVVRADRKPQPTALRAVKREAKPASASRDKTAAIKPSVAAKASSALPPRALSSKGVREPKLTPSMYKVQNAPASREPLVAAKVAKSANVLSSAAVGEAIKPSTSGYNNVLRAQATADAAAAAKLSEDDAETARIARLKVDHFDLWSALYAEDEEIYQRPILSKANPAAMSVGRR